VRVNSRRVRAIFRKELREYRHNGFIVLTMAIFPLIFLIQPLVVVFALPASTAAQLSHEHLLLHMLGIPAIVPAAVAAYAVVGERQQGTLEPVLTTPIRRQEFLLGKALAALVPSVAIAYAVYAVFLACVGLFAQPPVASALLRGPDLLAQLLFTPLLAGWSIWIGIAISARANDFRVAQQLGILASLPTAVVAALVAFNVIHPTLGLALGLAAALLLGNRLGWRITSATFDRERLITGGPDHDGRGRSGRLTWPCSLFTWPVQCREAARTEPAGLIRSSCSHRIPCARYGGAAANWSWDTPPAPQGRAESSVLHLFARIGPTKEARRRAIY
jgi:ABC-type transport system involved in multi-copper enzyme maturation permease subunit